MNYKYFLKDGSTYVLKSQPILRIVLCLIIFGIIYLLYANNQFVIMWIVIAIAVIPVYLMFKNEVKIDASRKEIFIEEGKNKWIIPFEKIEGINVVSVEYVFFTIMASLEIYYQDTQGKDRTAAIGTGVSKRRVQRILNELEEIINETKRI